MADAVKLDSELLKEIENFLEKRENRIKYQSKKHFVDVAVLSLLEKEFKSRNALTIGKKKGGRIK